MSRNTLVEILAILISLIPLLFIISSNSGWMVGAWYWFGSYILAWVLLETITPKGNREIEDDYGIKDDYGVEDFRNSLADKSYDWYDTDIIQSNCWFQPSNIGFTSEIHRECTDMMSYLVDKGVNTLYYHAILNDKVLIKFTKDYFISSNNESEFLNRYDATTLVKCNIHHLLKVTMERANIIEKSDWSKMSLDQLDKKYNPETIKEDMPSDWSNIKF